MYWVIVCVVKEGVPRYFVNYEPQVARKEPLGLLVATTYCGLSLDSKFGSYDSLQGKMRSKGVQIGLSTRLVGAR